MKIIWTKSAVLNLESIKSYIAQDSQYYAVELIEKVFGAVEKLSVFPRLGREVPEIKKENIREIIYRNYRILYRIDTEVLYIIAIIHAARDFNQVKLNQWEIF
ncbi:MAG TPA: type II toxin-antitoxin system RelE/ParE family toxin [Clostridiales bacterium]|jgi:plasmid stabilization system protein ParE|nr:type II toxin-antitoxin system RelE/ParE family toxin [Clostridiales bacterium]